MINVYRQKCSYMLYIMYSSPHLCSQWITPQCTQLNIMLEVHLPYLSKKIVQIHKCKVYLLAIVINIQTTFALVSWLIYTGRNALIWFHYVNISTFMLSVDKPIVHWKINTLSITFVDLCQRKVLLIFKLIEDPTTRIPNSSSSSSSSVTKNPDCYISETKRAIRDLLVSKRP